MSRSSCVFCGEKADLFCDGELGFMGVMDMTGKEPRLCIDIHQRLTCDVEICQSCATRKGMIHFKMGRSGFWDSTDYCPVCIARHTDANTGTLHGVINPPVIFATSGDAESARRAHNAKIRRAVMLVGGRIAGQGQMRLF
jgi:hypothetical protein